MDADGRAISFPMWQQELSRADMGADARERYRREILSFLPHCKVRRAPATVMLAKSYLAEVERQGRSEARLALRWFVQAARAGAAQATAVERAGMPMPVRRTAVPPPAAQDLGGADWERDLITAVRRAGFLWRTEETYRMWAVRFARFIAPRSPYAAGAEEVAAFLTKLAVEQRASP